LREVPFWPLPQLSGGLGAILGPYFAVAREPGPDLKQLCFHFWEAQN
jgi:hypothetical protein